jgi:hypothetical protein
MYVCISSLLRPKLLVNHPSIKIKKKMCKPENLFLLLYSRLSIIDRLPQAIYIGYICTENPMVQLTKPYAKEKERR